MNVTNAPLQALPIPASMPPSRRLSMAIDVRPKRPVPQTPVHDLQTDLASPREVTTPKAVLSVEAAPAPYSHWGINE